jgi:UDP-GlcNAc:undecaprenyl-phosphate GlcNAc-1-phosphate transferase
LVIVNSLNFLDNMDGLAAGVTMVAACALLSAAVSVGQLFVSGWLCLLIGATLGFLLFNFPPARIFMGDAGSMVLGYMLAVLTMLITYYNPARSETVMYGLLAPLMVLVVPLYDFLSVLTIRIREKRNPMVGDTRHFSHRLVRKGMSPRAAILTIWLCTAVTGIAAVLLPQVNNIGAALLSAQTIGVLGVIAMLESVEKRA